MEYKDDNDEILPTLDILENSNLFEIDRRIDIILSFNMKNKDHVQQLKSYIYHLMKHELFTNKQIFYEIRGKYLTIPHIFIEKIMEVLFHIEKKQKQTHIDIGSILNFLIDMDKKFGFFTYNDIKIINQVWTTSFDIYNILNRFHQLDTKSFIFSIKNISKTLFSNENIFDHMEKLIIICEKHLDYCTNISIFTYFLSIIHFPYFFMKAGKFLTYNARNSAVRLLCNNITLYYNFSNNKIAMLLDIFQEFFKTDLMNIHYYLYLYQIVLNTNSNFISKELSELVERIVEIIEEEEEEEIESIFENEIDGKFPQNYENRDMGITSDFFINKIDLIMEKLDELDDDQMESIIKENILLEESWSSF